jgi:hypothetical protein
VFGGRLITVAGVVDVAEELARPRRAWIDVGGLAQIPERRFELVAPAVGVAAHQVADHRVALERDGAAEFLDGGGQIAGGHGGVALPNQVAMTVLAVGDDVAVNRRQRSQDADRGEQAFHPQILALSRRREPRAANGF